MKYHEDNRVFLITGKQLNLNIWLIEQMMDQFQNDVDMTWRLGKLRKEMIDKVSYEELLDKLGIPQAPSEDEVGMVDFLNSFGLKPYEGEDEDDSISPDNNSTN